MTRVRSQATAIVVLGMHRSGTSCLAGMLAAGGLASAGDAVRNWDNARGHHEMLALVRLNEAVLAHCGGHWLRAPETVQWTEAHAAERDRLLATTIEGRPALLKDPRMLLVLPFWRASSVPFRAIGIVRHPLAVARSLASWREMPLADGVALWIAHVSAMIEDRAHRDYPVIDFDRPESAVVSRVLDFAGGCDPLAVSAAYDASLVHHDASPGVDSPARGRSSRFGHEPVPRLDEALALHHRLVEEAPADRPRYPREALDRFAHALAEGRILEARIAATDAVAAIADAAAVLVPVVSALVRRRAFADARTLIAEHAPRLDAGLADLLDGKVLLAARDAAAAVIALERACAVERPYFQARHVLATALREARRTADARAVMQQVARESLYAHGPLSTLAEWSWLDGDRATALTEMAIAIAAAPLHRRGRLRTRRAEMWIACGDFSMARAELERATEEDPGYTRSREILAVLP